MKSKTILPALLIGLLVFTSCNEKNAAESGAAASESGIANAISTTDLIGYWVNEAWWKELQSTKSPRQAAAKTKGITGAIFLQNEAMTTANLSINWHEGAQYAVRTREGKQELYDPNNAAVATIPLAVRAGGGISLEGADMVRLAPSLEGAKAVGHAVLGGQWDMNGKTVVFNPDGTVAGLDNYRYYELLLDYVVDEVGADQLSLSENGGQPVHYAFKIDGSKLVVSEMEDVGGKGEFVYKVGKVKYDLLKK